MVLVVVEVEMVMMVVVVAVEEEVVMMVVVVMVEVEEVVMMREEMQVDGFASLPTLSRGCKKCKEMQNSFTQFREVY